MFGRIHYMEIVQLFQSAASTAERLEHVADQALALYYLGMAWSAGGVYTNARQVLEIARTLALRRSAHRILALIMHQLGVNESEYGNYSAAREYYHQALAYFIKNDVKDKNPVQPNYVQSAHALKPEDQHVISAILHSLGYIEQMKGNYPAARKYFGEALVLQRELNNKQGVARILHNLGLIEQMNGDYPIARRCYEESLDIKRELNYKDGIAATLNNLAIIEYKEGNYLAALLHLEESCSIYEQLGFLHELENSRKSLKEVRAKEQKQSQND